MLRHRRLTAVMAALLLAPTLAVVALETSDPASAAAPAPVILNTGAQNGTGAQWAETQGLPDDGGVRDFWATFLVTHAQGRRINNVRIDRDYNGNDDTGNAGNNVAVTDETFVAANGNGIETSRVTVHVAVGKPSGFGCPLFGSKVRQVDAPIKVRVVDNTGEVSTSTLSTTVRFTEDSQCSGSADYPRLTAASQNLTEVTPGTNITYHFSCDDVDTNFLSDDDECERANIRWRRLADGDTGGGFLKTGMSDNSDQSFTMSFPSRGYYVVEAQLGNENGDLPKTQAPTNGYVRIGNAVVNGDASTLSGSFAFSGAQPSSPPSVNAVAGGTSTATLTAADAGGTVQGVEWDATGDGVYEGFEYSVPTVSGGDVSPQNLTAAERQRAVSTSTPGVRTINARITDDGGFDMADNIRRQKTITGQLRVNAIPTASDVTATTAEDNAVVVNMVGADSDAQPDPLAYAITASPPVSAGVLSLQSGGHITFTPAANFNGTTTFTYVVADGSSGTVGAHATSNEATATITVTPVNDLPTVDGNSITTDEDTPGTAHMTGNDVEDGTNLSFTAANGAHGTASCNATTDVCTYTPNADFNGSDAFVVTVHDSEGGTATVTVPVTVDPVNDAPVATDDTVHVTEDAPSFAIALTASDIDSTVLTFSGPDTPTANGSLSCVGQACTYTPDANFHGSDQFTFTVSDGALTDSGTIDIVVDSVNDAPVATDGPDAVTDEDVPVAITATGTDVDGDPVTVSSATDPAHGTTNVTGPNEVTYQGDQDVNGTDLFDFTVVDGNGGSNVGHVQVTVNPVNDAPVAADQDFTVDEDTPQILSIVGSDIDGDLLSWSLVSQGAHGQVVGTGPDVIYVPDHDFHGDDTFVVRVSDGPLDDTASVTVHVTPVNDQPVADSGTVTTAEDTSASFSLVGSDVDGDALTYTVDSTTANGALSCANEVCTYTPDADVNGADHLSFTVSDGTLTDSASVTIVVTPVNDLPVALPTLVGTDEDTPVAVPLHVTDVDGDALTYSVDTPTFGTIEGIAPDLVYVPNLNANGVETIGYSVDDGHGGTAGNVIGITVDPVDDAPVATGGSIATDEDTPVGFQLGGTDVEGDALTFTVDTAPPASAGALSCDAAGACTFDPTPDTNGDVPIGYTVSDGSLSSSAVFTVVVDPINDPPAATDQAVATSEDTAVSITLVATDTEGDALTYSAGSAAHGSVACTDASCVYTPASNYNGSDSFTFTADDGTSPSNTATVALTVTSVNDAPQALDIAKTTDEDTPVTILLMATDVDGDAITYTIDTPPAHGTVTNPGAGMAVTYTPATDFGGTDSFTYRATDPSGAYTTGTVSLVVDEVPLIATSVRGEASVAKVKITLVGLLTSINATVFPNLVAHLTTSTGAPVAGKPLTFTIGNTTLCTATTDATGTATCASGIITGIQSLLNLGYKVGFAGDDDHLPSNGRGSVATVIVLAL
jgi:hypothetical protein